MDFAVMAAEDRDHCARFRVPQPRCLVLGGSDDARAVRREGADSDSGMRTKFSTFPNIGFVADACRIAIGRGARLDTEEAGWAPARSSGCGKE